MDYEMVRKILVENIDVGDSSVIRELPLDVRKDIFSTGFCDDILFESGKLKIPLFTSEEAQEICLNEEFSLFDTFKKDLILRRCSAQFKISNMDKINCSSIELASTITSKSNKINFFKRWLESEKSDPAFVINVIRCLGEDVSEKLVFILCNYINSEYTSFGELFADANTIKEIIKIVPVVARGKCFDELFDIYCETTTSRSLPYDDFVDIFKLMAHNDRIEVFKRIVDYHVDNNCDFYLEHLNLFLNVVDQDKILIFRYYLDNNLLGICFDEDELLVAFSDNEKFEIIDMIAKSSIEQMGDSDFAGSKVFSDGLLAGFVLSFSDENRILALKRLVFSSTVNSHFNVINWMDADIDFRFKALDLKIQSLNFEGNEEEKKHIFDIVYESVIDYESNCPDGIVVYNNIIKLYADVLGLDIDNLTSFIKKFGYNSLAYLKNDNFCNFINLDKVNFEKLISVFSENNCRLDSGTINTVVNALLQRKFVLDFPEEYVIFNRLDNMIKDNNTKDLLDILRKINSVIDIDVDGLFYDISNKKDGVIGILHQITSQYLMKRRELYVKEQMNEVLQSLNLIKKYDKSYVTKEWFKKTDVDEICNMVLIIKTLDNIKLSSEQINFLNNEKLLRRIVEFKKYGYPISNEEKSYLKIFDSLVEFLYNNEVLPIPLDAKCEYLAKEVSLEGIIEIINDFDIKRINDRILNDENIFKAFYDFLSKYKLMGWGDSFEPLCNGSDLVVDKSTLVGLFNYFDRIYSEGTKDGTERVGLSTMLALANCYMSVSSKYGILFGDRVYKLLVANPGRNRSHVNTNERLESCGGYIKSMYMRDSVAVPTMDRDIELFNGKKVNVVVGNTTSMINLVLGELTDSCLRCGGAFDNLFQECLFGENGFHIVFYEPVTGQFISRVSGIRNGNTVFLNELRCSVCASYTDEDCVNAVRMIAKLLIEESRNSKFPIENVVITADYAMASESEKLERLNLENRRRALYGLHHNMDDDCNAIVLASSRDDNSLVPVVIGSDKISYYSSQRDKVRIYNGIDAAWRCAQMGMVNGLLSGCSMSLVNGNVDYDVVWCISGEDWFISVDYLGEIREFVIQNCKDKERTIAEMNSCRSVVFEIKKGVSR